MIYGCKGRKLLYLCSVICVMLIGLQYFKVYVQAEEYIYDDLNRVIQVNYEDGGTVEYIYDNNGNIVKTIVSPAYSDDSGELPQIPESAESNTSNEKKDSQKQLNSAKVDEKTSYESQEAELREGAVQSGNENENFSYIQSGKTSAADEDMQAQGETICIDERVILLINHIVQKITEYAKQTFA